MATPTGNYYYTFQEGARQIGSTFWYQYDPLVIFNNGWYGITYTSPSYNAIVTTPSGTITIGAVSASLGEITTSCTYLHAGKPFLGTTSINIESPDSTSYVNSMLSPTITYDGLRFRKCPGDIIHMHGGLSAGGAITKNTTIFTIPSGYRPPRTIYLTAFFSGYISGVWSDGAVGLVIGSDGTLKVTDNTTAMDVRNIAFYGVSWCLN